ncbi:MAG TPA: hypothetical protein VGD37_40205 [Kofleriaceae bacterium]|jgi:hypothetical protein
MPRSILVLLALVALVLLSVPVPAAAGGGKQVRYVGIHPMPRSEGGGICYIEGPHVHIYDADRIQYRDHRGANYFVGDPVAYGYDGPRYAYKGHHPIHVNVVVGDEDPDDEYCYLSGPHFHYFAPPDGPEFKLAGGAYFYVGEPPRAYVEARPAMMRINAVYQPLVYERPQVTIEAPVGWIGARAEFAAPAVVVAPPSAVIVPPSAGISIEAHVPMPSLHVDVGIGAPAVIVHEAPGVIIEERVRVKHDHGRHRGHYK